MEEKMTIYKILKPILGSIYKFWYNPKVIGKENIKNDGPIILAGNHVHIMDQCNIIISTNRCIHYMAKKEYFDNKKVAWFFKLVQCIPVDRSKKDDSAKQAAIDVLKNNYALGIFPEGTRNSLKEERIKELYEKYFSNLEYKMFKNKIINNKTSFINYLEKLMENDIITEKEFKDNIYNADKYLKELINEKKITEEDYYNNYLLPLKFGTVSMAQKTNAWITPYAITGTYKFRSKDLKIIIGKPFQVGQDLEEANTKLAKEIEKLVKESLKNNCK